MEQDRVNKLTDRIVCKAEANKYNLMRQSTSAQSLRLDLASSGLKGVSSYANFQNMNSRSKKIMGADIPLNMNY